MSNVREAMAATAAAVEAELERLIPTVPASAAPLLAAMRHGTLGGGKRLRPFLVRASGEPLGADPAACLRAGTALEMVHGYSLIHDDLPAMDDAALRRGRPTVHRAFDEATAILAGDALLTLAFEALGRDDWPAAPARKVALVRGLAAAAGAEGMCGGQTIDLLAEKQTLSLDATGELQRLKTGALIAFGCQAGAVLAGADPATFDPYAARLGLAFQIRDDLLDVEGDAQSAGKDLGRDAAAGKATFVAHLGAEGAKAELRRLRDAAIEALDPIDADTTLLRDLVGFVIARDA